MKLKKEFNVEWLEWLKHEFAPIFNLLDAPIIHLNNGKFSLSGLLLSVLIIWGSIKIAKSVGKMTNSALEKKDVDSGIRDSLERFVRYLIIAMGVLFSLDNLGFSISSLAGLGAVLMVGIGFGLQNIAQNFISGIIILIERPIKVGDIIQVGSSSGRVLDIRVRSTIIQTRDEVSIIVPNSKLISEEVVNDSYASQKIRQHIKIGVAYGTEVALVQKTLSLAALSHSQVLKDPPPRVIFTSFGESSLDFDLRFWCSDIWEVDLICSEIRCEIDRLFRIEKIQIPFPQRDLHLINHDIKELM
jgi:small-conductance mechanosensitive channel